MLQIYFLSIIYLIFSSLLLLLDYHREQLAFLLRLRSMLRDNRKAQQIHFISGLAISILLLFFPISPGPMILGDFIPSIVIAFESFYFLISYSDKNKDRGLSFNGTKLEVKKRNAGYASLIVALLHFLFPSFVLI